MARIVSGYKQSLTSAQGAQPVLGGYDGDYDVTIRALSTGIFLGGDNVASSLPNTGFELIQDKDYTFAYMAAADHEPYLATTSSTAVYAYVFLTPRL